MSTLTAPPISHFVRARPAVAAATVRLNAVATVAPTPDALLQLGMGFFGSKTLLSAIELEVFTQLAREPGTCEELQRRLGLHPRAARDFLDALVALGALQRTGRVYLNTPASALFLDKAKPSYVGGLLEMANQRLYRFWGNLTEALQTGRPQNEASRGELPLFDALYAEPARLRQFLGAMTGLSRGANIAIAADFPWSKYRTFADVGTAQGDLAVQVARAHRHLTGVGFDLPVAGPIFNAYAEDQGVADRVSFVPGDFFNQPLPKADVIMMGHILHDWDLAQKRQLVRAAYEALPEGGAFIVYDTLIDDDRRQNAFGLLMSLNMLIETPGGFDYTAADAMGWMKEAGFRESYSQHLVGPDAMVVAVK
jgi:ubiquinone/menaquinone biosynthesis C-methylase UbiE